MKTMVYNIGQLATPLGTSARRGKEMGELRVLSNAAVYAEDGIIRAVGSQEEVLREHPLTEMDCCVDAGQKAVIPGFVDSHTHFLFGGYRVRPIWNCCGVAAAFRRPSLPHGRSVGRK